MSRAICVRCGVSRTDYRAPCPGCGFAPEGEGVAVAWLLSSEHLDDAALDAVQERVRSGESVEPSARMIATARRALQQDFSSDPGLDTRQRLLILGTSLLLTPAVGWVLWWTWRRSRPRAAWQAFALSAPATVAFTVLVLLLA